MWAGTGPPVETRSAALSAVMPAACSVAVRKVVCPDDDDRILSCKMPPFPSATMIAFNFRHRYCWVVSRVREELHHSNNGFVFCETKFGRRTSLSRRRVVNCPNAGQQRCASQKCKNNEDEFHFSRLNCVVKRRGHSRVRLILSPSLRRTLRTRISNSKLSKPHQSDVAHAHY
jgi:hypothetical protein